MSTYDEAYDQVLTRLLNATVKNGFAKAEIKPAKQKFNGSRNAIKRLKKVRKQSK